MTMIENSREVQLDRAIESTDLEELRVLFRSPYMNVRRAVARNSYIDTRIANTLAFDPVLNVSYMALKNDRCTASRHFYEENITSCVKCTRDERELECVTCKNKNSSAF